MIDAVEEHRDTLQDLAESDLAVSRIAKALLEASDPSRADAASRTRGEGND